MSTTFEKALTLLVQSEKPLPPAWLREFSDLLPDEIERLLAVWPQIALARKYAFLEDLETLFDQEMLVSFKDLGLALLNDCDAGVRSRALRLLKESGDVHLVPSILNLLQKDSDRQVRAEAAILLGEFVYDGELEELPSSIYENIQKALLDVVEHDEDPEVQRRALESLGFSSNPQAMMLIRAAYQRSDPRWIASALFAMGRSANPQWEELILPMLFNEESEVRRRAVQAAGELGLSSARPVLLRLLEEEDLERPLLEAIIWALSQIGGEDVRLYLEALLDQAEDDDLETLLEDALDNLDFTENLARFDLLAFDVDDLEGEEDSEDPSTAS